MRGEKVASAQDFVGNQRERTTLGRGFLFLVFFFLVYLVTIMYCSDIVWSKDLSGCFFFFRSLIGNFLSFFASSHSLIGNFSFFLFFFFVFRGQGFMISWDFGSRLVEWLVMIYVRVWPAVRG